MWKSLAVLGLAVAFVGCGSSTSNTGGGGLSSFSDFCVAADNAFCTRLYACEGAGYPGSVAECETSTESGCASKTCPTGTTFNATNASACVTAYQNESCPDIEAAKVPATGCGNNCT
jgi:hypothetical protein